MKKMQLKFLLISSYLMTISYKSIFCSASARHTHLLVSALKLQVMLFEDSPFLEDRQVQRSIDLCEGSLQIAEPF